MSQGMMKCAAALGLGTVAVGWLAPPAPACDVLVATFANSKVVRYDGSDGTLVGDFVPTGGGGLDQAHAMTYGPDGHLYVASFNNGAVMRYDGQTGANLPGPLGAAGTAQFVTPGSAGLSQASGVAFGPDGNIYVASLNDHCVRRYSGATGGYINEFVGFLSGGLNGAEMVTFGADGHLYVGSLNNDAVMRYNGATGAPLPGPLGAGGTAQFVPPGAGGLDAPHDVSFGPDGHLYVSSLSSGTVYRFNGATGAFIDVFAAGITSSHGHAFSFNGDLFAVGFGFTGVKRYAGADGTLIGDFVGAGAGGMSQPADLVFLPGCFSCPADLDGSGSVDVTDLLELLAKWGSNPLGPPDFDNNLTVDTGDLLGMLAGWGSCE